MSSTYSSYYTVDIATTKNIDVQKKVEDNTFVDGKLLLVNMNILMKDQRDKTQNNIYVLSKDRFLSPISNIPLNSFVFVRFGLQWENIGFMKTSNESIFSPISKTSDFQTIDPIIKEGNVINLNYDDDIFELNTQNQLSLKTPLADNDDNGNFITHSDGKLSFISDLKYNTQTKVLSGLSGISIGNQNIRLDEDNRISIDNLIGSDGIEYIKKSEMEDKINELKLYVDRAINSLNNSTNNSIDNSQAFILNKADTLYVRK